MEDEEEEEEELCPLVNWNYKTVDRLAARPKGPKREQWRWPRRHRDVNIDDDDDDIVVEPAEPLCGR